MVKNIEFTAKHYEIELPDEAEYQAKLGGVEQSLENDRMEQYMEGFVASLYRNAKIETNESVVTLES